jgi:hypothetical protein
VSLEPENPIVSKVLEENQIGKTPDEIERFFKFQGVNNVAEFLNGNLAISSFIYNKIKELH